MDPEKIHNDDYTELDLLRMGFPISPDAAKRIEERANELDQNSDGVTGLAEPQKVETLGEREP